MLINYVFYEYFCLFVAWTKPQTPATLTNIFTFANELYINVIFRRQGWMWLCWILTTVGYVRSKVDDDRESAAVVSVVGQRRAEARRPALTGVRAALLVEGCGTEVLVAGGEQILVQYVAHLWGIGHWAGEGAGRHRVKTLKNGRNSRGRQLKMCKYMQTKSGQI